MALDESENALDTVIRENDIDVLLGNDIKGFLERGKPVSIDFNSTPHGSGFYIDTGSHC